MIVSLVFLSATFAVNRQVACLSAILVGMLLYHAAVAVAFASPHFRYIVPQVPLAIMLAALGIGAFRTIIGRERMNYDDPVSQFCDNR